MSNWSDEFRKKDDGLTREAEALTQQATKVKANIKLVILGLKELQNINLEGPKKPRNIDIFAWKIFTITFFSLDNQWSIVQIRPFGKIGSKLDQSFIISNWSIPQPCLELQK